MVSASISAHKRTMTLHLISIICSSFYYLKIQSCEVIVLTKFKWSKFLLNVVRLYAGATERNYMVSAFFLHNLPINYELL